MPLGFRKTNHYAVAGFLLPFMTAALACIVVLFGYGSRSPGFWFLFIGLFPLLLCTGLVFSIKSIPLIRELGDKDYAYSGLVLNIFFIFIYLYAVLYLRFFMN
jgi:hypothetical protein